MNARGDGGRVKLNADWLRRRFAAAVMLPEVREDGARAQMLRAAAVLVPVVLRPAAMSVLLTRRADHLHHHPGQISFPGGGVEPGDATAEMTALRETEEEIGLSRERVEPLGRLPDYLTGTGFRVTPIVGLVHPPFELKLDAFEVAEAFEVPLAHFLDPANHQRHSKELEGRMRHYYAMPYGSYFIWGATAGMLRSLYAFLCEEHEPGTPGGR